ncbi:MAG: DUF5050 domain-containing protein [Ruminiclostridium sp.]|nr:DUF5050 domain-containing protein [Ruminiclostridium sp.]
MKRPAKILTLLTAAALSVALLAACGSGSQETSAQEAIHGRSIFIDESGVAFWGYGPYICTGLVDENGHIYDPVIEGQTTSDIYGMAVYNKDLYLASDDGLFRYDLEIFQEGGTMSPTLLTEDSIDDGFEIWEDTIYYRYGTSLYSIPIDGGEETKVATETDNFTVTADGIYYAADDGGIYRLSFDGALQERIIQTEEDCLFTLAGDTIYYRCEGSDQICQLNLADGSTTVVNKPRSLSDYSYLWVFDGQLLYEDSHYERFLLSLSDGSEVSMGDDGFLPDQEEGFLVGDILYGCNIYTGSIQEYHLTTGEICQLETEPVVQAALLAQTDTTSGSSTALPADYDILSGLQITEGNQGLTWVMSEHIIMSFPTQYATQLEQYDATSFGIVYVPAALTGYGGQLVTIAAYPMGDTSYQEAPSWTLAGEADGLQYVAFFPTDVQFDPNDPTQREEYPALLEYLRQIGSTDAPFQCGAIGQGGP